jgi:hypothetical protein
MKMNCRIARQREFFRAHQVKPRRSRLEEQDMQREPGHLLNEADIGSGEKSAGQKQTDDEIAKVDNPKMDKAGGNEAKAKKESVRKAPQPSDKR